LLPLRCADIAEMVIANEDDPELFLSEVEARGVGVLAARPLTLTFLLRTFAKNGRRLPERAVDLYRDNLLAMCGEHNPDRRTASPRAVSPGDLYAVARRVAAASVFGGATAVWLGPFPSPTGEDLIAADDLEELARGFTTLAGTRRRVSLTKAATALPARDGRQPALPKSTLSDRAQARAEDAAATESLRPGREQCSEPS